MRTEGLDSLFNFGGSDNDAPTKWGFSCHWLYVTVTDTLNRYSRYGMNEEAYSSSTHNGLLPPLACAQSSVRLRSCRHRGVCSIAQGEADWVTVLPLP